MAVASSLLQLDGDKRLFQTISICAWIKWKAFNYINTFLTLKAIQAKKYLLWSQFCPLKNLDRPKLEPYKLEPYKERKCDYIAKGTFLPNLAFVNG